VGRDVKTTCIRGERDEGVLIQQARTGNAEAFSNLVKMYSAGMYRISRRILRNHEDAEDNVQNSLWKAYDNIDRFEGRARFSTWLFRIAINEALMQIRSRPPEHNNIDVTKGADDGSLPDFCDASPNPERRFIVKELTTKAFLALKPATVDLFVRNQSEGWTQRELASKIGITPSAVKSRIFAAREQMRERLRDANSTKACPLAASVDQTTLR